MTMFLALIDRVLADLSRSRLSAPPADRVTLAPVWAMPMVRRADPPAAPSRHR
ncbi:MAG TPA: hypothetical protein VFO41_13070 [Alphaproteobacteria bacterium]|nr:hypothetical protein [Alphaproteobacteria bacterium]